MSARVFWRGLWTALRSIGCGLLLELLEALASISSLLHLERLVEQGSILH